MENKIKVVGLKLVKFIVIFLLVDFSMGYVAKRLYFSQKTGKQARITNVIEDASPDILIFGSSHAVRHYVPDIIEQKLQKTCYNTGVRGQGVLFTNTLQKLVLKRTKPELIILNVDSNWLNEDNLFYDRLVDLHPYYWEHRDIIKPTLSLKSKFVDFKLFFRAYQTNSTLAHVLKYAIAPQQDYNGYLPQVAKFKIIDKKTGESQPIHQSPSPTDTDSIIDEKSAIDANFIDAYRSFIETTKENNIALYLFISPSLQNLNANQRISLNKLKSIAATEKVKLIDLMKDKRFIKDQNLFRDKSHLNEAGARLFSQIISDTIKSSGAPK